ncbi:nucleoside-diphosphate-sugar epimerase [Stackebrandtia endophytica]|uniref:Nucleoside-diphosphate-sugar epimerase n=1 Tax=Stackebrandtia endophytica TaxID=1496996 RepID=A0A543B133_9ACTN|nr:NAD(P)-dependent oxidoreductase [Stackebrandtia endophytica]TQL78541.1 nucleoside-diphosphate-sugar epimerase [Stackebrandtia endophytica]
MRVVVAGATGVIGSELCRQLSSAGHAVIGITRTEPGARRLRERGADAVIADVMNRDALLRALDGVNADAVIHQATAISGVPVAHRDVYATDALRDRGTANLLAAARGLGAERFVTQSFLFGYGYRDHGEAPVTEAAPFGLPEGTAFDPHLAAMRANEDQVLGADDLVGVSLRYGIFYGYEPSTLSLFTMAERRLLVAPRRGGAVSFVHIADAASAAVAALRDGRAGQAYNIADDEPVGWATYMDAIAAEVGRRKPWRIPNTLLRLAPYLATLMTRCRLRLDTTKAHRDLDWRPRYSSIHAGLREAAALRRDDA